jgi:hypothetical protein
LQYAEGDCSKRVIAFFVCRDDVSGNRFSGDGSCRARITGDSTASSAAIHSGTHHAGDHVVRRVALVVSGRRNSRAATFT